MCEGTLGLRKSKDDVDGDVVVDVNAVDEEEVDDVRTGR